MLAIATVCQIVRALMPVFTEVLVHYQTSEPQWLKANLLKTCLQAELALRRYCIDDTAIADIRFGLIAWMDDWLMNHDWPGINTWRLSPLQQQCYNEQNAGVTFFQRLETCRLQGYAALPVIFAYSLCLEMGFLGQYRLSQSDTCARLISALRSNVIDITKSPQVEQTTLSKPVPKIWRWRWLLVTVLLVIFIVNMVISQHHEQQQENLRVLTQLKDITSCENC